MEYQITGTVKLELEFTVHAESEESARKLSVERLKDFYHLDSIGSYHCPEEVKINLIVDEL